MPARLLAAADVYHAMREPRPHREPIGPAQAAEILGQEASAGRLDADAVTAVIEAAGQPVPPIERPAGLTEREGRWSACSPAACRPSMWRASSGTR
jgi:hypothetical protein